jgi:hypothetical protein
MSRKDRLWHLSKNLSTHRNVIFCAWLVSMQDSKHWPVSACLAMLLLGNAISKWLLVKEREKEAKKQEEAP